MKMFKFFLLFLLVSNLLLGQSDYGTMTFLIVDQEANRPLKGASIAVKELGYQSLVTGSDGNAYFKEVPIGEINYLVILEGYKSIEGSFNITTIDKNNSLRIQIPKIPTKESKVILFSGEITDENKKEVPQAKLELRVGNVSINSETDESGNFNIEADLKQVQYNINEFILEISSGECKEKRRFAIPRNNYLYKEIQLTCSGVDEAPLNKLNKRRDFVEDNGVWRFELKNVQKKGRDVECDFVLKSYDKDLFFRVYGYKSAYQSKIYDQNGNESFARYLKVANIVNLPYIDRNLIAGVEYHGKIIFTGLSPRATSISMIELVVNDGSDYYPLKLQFRNISF